MPVSHISIAALLACLIAAPVALAADPLVRPPGHVPPRPSHVVPHRGACLSKAEQRAAVASHRAISLAQAIRSLRSHGKRAEVVRARLCKRGDNLVYVLTLLAHSGKVIRADVDASSGEFVTGR
jgi:hypothetical protein